MKLSSPKKTIDIEEVLDLGVYYVNDNGASNMFSDGWTAKKNNVHSYIESNNFFFSHETLESGIKKKFVSHHAPLDTERTK